MVNYCERPAFVTFTHSLLHDEERARSHNEGWIAALAGIEAYLGEDR